MRAMIRFGLAAGITGLALSSVTTAQEAPVPPAPPAAAVTPLQQLASLAGVAGVTGAEEAVIARIRAALPAWAATSAGDAAAAAVAVAVDHVGNLRVTVGSGESRRVVLCHVDEIGWRVTQVTDEGYLRIASPGHTARRDIADRLLEGKQIIVQGDHGELNGAVTAQSTHLKGARPALFDLDRAWIDIGARSQAEARTMGAAELSPVAWRRIVRPIAHDRLTGPALGDRVGATTVLQAMHRLDPAKVQGTVVFLFAVQRWHRGYQGVGRGGEVAALDLGADEVIGVAASVDAPLGQGAVIPTPLAASRDALPEALRGRTQVGNVEDPGLRAWTRRTRGWKVCGVPVRYRYTPVEMVDGGDCAAAADCLTHWLQGGK